MSELTGDRQPDLSHVGCVSDPNRVWRNPKEFNRCEALLGMGRIYPGWFTFDSWDEAVWIQGLTSFLCCGPPVGGPSIVSGKWLCAHHWFEERKVSWLTKPRLKKEAFKQLKKDGVPVQQRRKTHE